MVRHHGARCLRADVRGGSYDPARGHRLIHRHFHDGATRGIHQALLELRGAGRASSWTCSPTTAPPSVCSTSKRYAGFNKTRYGEARQCGVIAPTNVRAQNVQGEYVRKASKLDTDHAAGGLLCRRPAHFNVVGPPGQGAARSERRSLGRICAPK